MIKFLPGSSNYVMRTALLLAGNCFYIEIVSRISLPGLPGFAAKVSLVRCFVPGRFTACPGTDFATIFSPGKSPG